MLILSLIFVSLIILLVFCLAKDTGEHTAFARKNASINNQQESTDSSHNRMTSTKTLNAN
ncbi:hypothetical protein Q4567_12245 [Aliiglaciecola sp. 2_MG-2023]|uniref:hypothetical protein n=1 Tax=Alteromonadaceae TaxID=72275 RepID=UPI0026E11BCD|nr:hypothetical protein [Aliiglaciecola sp. 2_MG-2023]MBU2876569.1 hypothetical protein [Aliiglaciecola lipolytica]MDO6711496.1 hypothetical protein [Aliiglaciecola sp. 2_MG-2023]